MKYVKAPAPFDLAKAKKSMIRVFARQRRGAMTSMQQTKALMLPSSHKSPNMVLTADVKALKPFPSRGAILSRSHAVNVAPTLNSGVILLHPDIFDEYVTKGIIDSEGNYPPLRKKAPVKKEAKVVKEKPKKAAPKKAKKKAPAKAKPATLTQVRAAYKKKFGKMPPKNWKKETIAKRLV